MQPFKFIRAIFSSFKVFVFKILPSSPLRILYNCIAMELFIRLSFGLIEHNEVQGFQVLSSFVGQIVNNNEYFDRYS